MMKKDGWEKIHANAEWGGWPSESIIRPIARNFYKASNRKDVKILDFGCGAGAHTWYLAKEGFDVYAFDGSESAVKRTERRLEAEGLSAHLSVQDGTLVNYPAEMFDCVVDSVCICANMYQEIIEMYKKTYEILKQGGILISTGFSTKTTGYGSGEELEPGTYYNLPVGALSHPDTKVHFFTEKELYLLLREVGFKEVMIDADLRTDFGGKICIENLIAVAYK